MFYLKKQIPFLAGVWVPPVVKHGNGNPAFMDDVPTKTAPFMSIHRGCPIAMFIMFDYPKDTNFLTRPLDR
jgi:hypothetical protein